MSASVTALAQPGPDKDVAVAARLGRKRGRRSLTVKFFCVLATVLGLLLLFSILGTLLYLGFDGLSLTVFTRPTMAAGSGGGLQNAIIGTLIQTAIGTLIGTPIGLM